MSKNEVSPLGSKTKDSFPKVYNPSNKTNVG